MISTPLYTIVVFIAATVFTILMCSKATGWSKPFLYIVSGWLVLQGAIAATGFYTKTSGIPPRFLLAVGPALLAILVLFISRKGRKFLDGLDIRSLTLLHVVRLPVELVLFWLCIDKLVAPQMTFEGWNFDIFSGLSAPLAWYLLKKNPNSPVVLAWNFICLALLVNIVTIAILSAPVDFQQLSFHQPNIAVMYLPFIWLPAVIVPLVLLAQLASIRQLLRNRKTIERQPVQSAFTQ
jgi:hypothetical protein